MQSALPIHTTNAAKRAGIRDAVRYAAARAGLDRGATNIVINRAVSSFDHGLCSPAGAIAAANTFIRAKRQQERKMISVEKLRKLRKQAGHQPATTDVVPFADKLKVVSDAAKDIADQYALDDTDSKAVRHYAREAALIGLRTEDCCRVAAVFASSLARTHSAGLTLAPEVPHSGTTAPAGRTPE